MRLLKAIAPIPIASVGVLLAALIAWAGASFVVWEVLPIGWMLVRGAAAFGALFGVCISIAMLGTGD